MVPSYGIFKVKHVYSAWLKHVLHVFDKEVKV